MQSTNSIPYFFGFMKELFSFQNNPKNLDLSYKTDLDIWDCLERVIPHIIVKLHRTDLVICNLFREGITPSLSPINMVCLSNICPMTILKGNIYVVLLLVTGKTQDQPRFLRQGELEVLHHFLNFRENSCLRF